MYVLANTNKVEKYPYSYASLKNDNPQTSFPAAVTDELLAEWNVFPVIPTQCISQNDHTKVVTETDPLLIDGQWMQQWLVEDASLELLAERTANQASSVRTERNKLLTESDWTQVADAPVDKELWVVYRQALRDITEQPGFPWEVEWPEEPA